MPNTVKVTKNQWIETAKNALIAEGIGGVKIDRLANALEVTRGGFYYHFKGQKDLLSQLLEHWAKSNDFLPPKAEASGPKDAYRILKETTDRLIEEKDFSPAFEMAVREWARINDEVRKIVDKVDVNRIKKLTRLFFVLGYEKEETAIRARTLYFHQMGYYNLGYHKRQTKSERRKKGPIYMRIICGPLYLELSEFCDKATT